jgi:thymidylate synthase (FAD)
MKVELIQATTNPIKLIADIASICYGKEEANNPEKLVKNLNKLGHHSVFEHVWFTFKIEGISRACLAQLTRHRHASFTVRSQRYCEEGNFKAVVPDSIWNDKVLRDNYFNLMEMIGNHYDGLRESGIKREDARFVLPEATQTELYISLNLRELMHIYELRSTSNAQWEIRNLTNYMVSLIPEELKVLF